MSTIPGDSPANKPAAANSASTKTNSAAAMASDSAAFVDSFDAVFRSTIQRSPSPRTDQPSEESARREETKQEAIRPAPATAETSQEAHNESADAHQENSPSEAPSEPAEETSQSEDAPKAAEVEQEEEEAVDEEAPEVSSTQPILLEEPLLPPETNVEQEGGTKPSAPTIQLTPDEEVATAKTVQVEVAEQAEVSVEDQKPGEIVREEASLAAAAETDETAREEVVSRRTEQVQSTPSSEHGERRQATVRAETNVANNTSETEGEEENGNQRPSEEPAKRVRRPQPNDRAARRTAPQETAPDSKPAQPQERIAAEISNQRSHSNSSVAKNTQGEAGEPVAIATNNNSGQAVAPPRLPEHFIGPPRQVNRQPAVRGMNEVRLLGRVAKAFQAAQQRGGGPLRIRLHPSELGSLKIELKVESGNLTAKLEVETTAARNALVENLNVLRERLSEQGVRVEQFDVSLQADTGGADAELSDQEDDARSEHVASVDEDRSGEEAERADSAKTPDWNGKLNVII